MLSQIPPIMTLYREFFYEDYQQQVERSGVPLVYSRQSYSGLDTGLHRHEDHYAIYVVHGGRGVHTIDGHPYGMARGDVYLAPPGSTHSYRNFQNLEVDTFCFPVELFTPEEQAALRALPGFRYLFVAEWPLEERPEEEFQKPEWQKVHGEHRFHLSPERWNEIVAMVEEVRAELTRCQATPRPPGAALLARSLFFRLLVQLARWRGEMAQQALLPATGLPQRAFRGIEIADVLRVCEERFAEPLTVPQLASLMFLSPSRFAEIFTREVGAPPATYLRRLRLERAQKLLRTTKLSATAIAQQCGFHDAAQFSRAFRSAFNTTPSEYRASFKP